MPRNPNWREADQSIIYKHDRGVELGSTSLVVKAGRDLCIYVLRPNHSVTLPSIKNAKLSMTSIA